MERLSHREQDKIGNVHNIVDGALPDSVQQVFHPFGRFLHLHVADCNTRIARTCCCILYTHFDAAILLVDCEIIDSRLFERALIAVLLKPAGKVASHAIVGSGINAVGGEVHLEDIILGNIIQFGSGSARFRVAFEDDDAIVGVAYTDFVFGANHSKRFHTANLGFLNSKFFITVVEHSAESGNDNRLPGSDIGSAAHNLHSLVGVAGEVNCGYMKVVAVGVSLTGEDFAHHQSFETSFYRFHFLNAACLKTERGESGR